jgi:hypothetical protein|tara:strand:- start:652 stop:1806 length:1155 start_codon:yes stop_codon:yes gene_type:complete
MHIGNSTTKIKHDPYGPSTHPMLVKCPAYTSDSVETVHTIKGTEKHKYVEMFLDPTHECYTCDTDYLEELMGESNEMRDPDKQMDQQDIRDVQIAIDQTRSFIKGLEDKTSDTTYNNVVKTDSEKWVELNVLGISGGIPDLVITIGKSTVIVLDFKFGAKAVSPQSEQLLSYMAGLDPFVSKYKHRYTVIVQPRVYDEPQVFRVTDTHLNSHILMMKEVIEIAKLDNPPYIPHDKCIWCNKHMRCPATIGNLSKANQIAKSNKEVKIWNLPNNQLEEMVKVYEKIKSFGGALKQELYTRLHKGEELNNYELGVGRKSRHFHDDAEDTLVEECVKQGINPNDLYDSKLISVAKAEKLLGKKVISSLWYNQDGKLTVKRKKLLTKK